MQNELQVHGNIANKKQLQSKRL